MNITEQKRLRSRENFLRVYNPNEFFLTIDWIGKAGMWSDYFRVYAIRKNANPDITNQCWIYDVTRTIRTVCRFRYNDSRKAITVTGCGYSKKDSIKDAITAEISKEYHIETL